jgi:hypothetical protein
MKRKIDHEHVEFKANEMILNLNRFNIFPPLFNDPKFIISKNCKKQKKKRAPNAFFICRLNVHKEAERINVNINMRIICKATSILWNNANSEEKNEYIKLACLVKESMGQNQNNFNHYYIFQSSKESNTNIFKEEIKEIESYDTQNFNLESDENQTLLNNNNFEPVNTSQTLLLDFDYYFLY